MKRILRVALAAVFCTAIFSVTAYGQSDADKNSNLKAISLQVKEEKDEFNGVTYLRWSIQENSLMLIQQKYFLPYIGYNTKSQKWIVACAKVDLPTWIFMEKVIVLVGSERFETPTYDSNSRSVFREVTSKGVRESIHFLWSEPGVEKLGRAIANAPAGVPVKLRFQGNIDYVLSEFERPIWEDAVYYLDNFTPPTK